jgi:hypothetical protein
LRSRNHVDAIGADERSTELALLRVVYDDDLDTWSVVAIPFDGIYFTGSKMQCEAFATKYTERGVTTFRKSLGQQRFGISSSTASPGATWGSAQRQ